MSSEQENDLTPEVEDAPKHDQHAKMVPIIRSIGVVLALTAVIVSSYLLFNLETIWCCPSYCISTIFL